MTVPAATAGEGVTVRQAERADLLAVYRIETASFPQPWPYDAFECFLGEPGFLVAVDGKRVVGYVVADVTRSYGRGLGHVKDVAVHPDRRGRGVGSLLLARALFVLTLDGATSVKLEVRESNHRAQRLYESFGFETLRRVHQYYDDGEDALVMIRELEP
ncbi:ribosomal protein S18-alanine N-acetyltransferase [Natronobiforma cellulositropha]|uniref:ribosomal protein S18-alanine N-acetyltransferase n=1 Tax=Natronobiforma cellulositropha TaxID=1679076 RepID=UPI0021D58680|nr:ribosomal protein S18-alanine N-acetyltransferase [Natronobiforma cellulositropha]